MRITNRVVGALLVAVFLLPHASFSDEDSLMGLSVLMQVYTYQPGTFEMTRVAEVSLGEGLGSRRPASSNWFVRPIKNPPEPFSREEWKSVVAWVDREEAPGLVLDGHAELGDREIGLLKPLSHLILVSFQKTAVTVKGWTAMSKGGKIALLPKAYPAPWLRPAPTEPKTPTSFWFGATPEEGIRGRLPRDQFHVDYSLKLTTLDGHVVRLSSKKGQVMFLNFWATWCGPCRSEIPSLENLYQTLKDQKVFFAYVVAQPTGEIQAFLAKNPRKLPVYIAHASDFAPYISQGLPETVIISKRGDWVVHRLGADTWDTQEVIEYLVKLMNE